MPRVEEILQTPDINEFLQSNANAKDAVMRAAALLQNEDDAVLAVRKVMRPLSEKTIQVFFSYKKKDEDAAKAVVQALRKSTAQKLKITYMADFTEEFAGRKWRKRIREAIYPANWFILLLPDPSDDWDWCLFETGVFFAQRTSADRLICLHHPDTQVPDQIKEYHAVSATQLELEAFLRMVHIKPDAIPGMEPLNTSIENEIENLAKQIMDAIRPPRKFLIHEIFNPWVELRFENPQLLSCMEDLDAAEIVDANQAALELFGFLKKPATFGLLRRDVVEVGNDSRWRNELFHVIRRIATDRTFSPVQAVFKAQDGSLHRPLAFAVDRAGRDGPVNAFHISFIEEISAVDRSAMPMDLAMLGDLLRFTFRFRWEVLEPFSKPPFTNSEAEQLQKTLKRLRVDWDSRHVGEDKEIFAIFSGEHQERFLGMSESWRKIMNEEGTGSLDLALKSGEIEKIPAMLKEFLPMNQEFLEIAAERFSNLISGGI
jgi:hypothetical protein